MQDRARQALAAARVHRQAVQGRIRDSRWPRKHFRFDLFEIFSGSGRVSIRAVSHWGLRVVQPVGFQRGMREGWSARQWLLGTLNKFEPRLVVMEDPRAAWAALPGHGAEPPNHDTHYDPDRDFLDLVKEIFEYQRSRGGHAVLETTAENESHNEPAMRKLRETHHETHYDLTVHHPFHRKGIRRLPWRWTDAGRITFVEATASRRQSTPRTSETRSAALTSSYKVSRTLRTAPHGRSRRRGR